MKILNKLFLAGLTLLVMSVSLSSQVIETPFYQSESYSLYPNRVVQGAFEAKALSSTEMVTNYQQQGVRQNKMTISNHWKLSADISRFPQMNSTLPLSDAIYYLSLEELTHMMKADGAFMAGRAWSNVWTREVANSAILSLAIVLPQEVKINLLKKVKNKRIVQDSGTGGGYPVSTDRVSWAIAAWELYLVTGDKEWLAQSAEIIKNTIDDDRVNAYDAETGLMKGETSSLDSREQTYPTWMSPTDIYESLALGTNVFHYYANKELAMMYGELNNSELQKRYQKYAVDLKKAINSQLWMYDKMAYSQYLYGRNYKSPSTRSGSFGQALAVLSDLLPEEMQYDIVEQTPVLKWGAPCLFPQKRDIPAYQNNAVWPFIQAYWALASKKVGNENSVLESIAAIYRPTGLFLTNVENFDADFGDYATTLHNSGATLNTIAGNLSLVYRVLFGMKYSTEGLIIHPLVPKSMGEKRTLTNVNYRNAKLTIEVEGYGDEIKSFEIDGKSYPSLTVPADLVGDHVVKVRMSDKDLSDSEINKQENYFTLAAPVADFKKGKITWKPVPEAYMYSILKNGEEIETVADTVFKVAKEEYAEYIVQTIDKNNNLSFLSKPVIIADSTRFKLYQFEDYLPKSNRTEKGYNGKGFIEISKTKNRTIEIPITIKNAGEYFFVVKYANGNGDVESGDKCAFRTLKIDGKRVAVFVFPQRGKGEWENWGKSNFIRAHLTKGNHLLTISYEKENENMDGNVNEALLDDLYVCRMSRRK